MCAVRRGAYAEDAEAGAELELTKGKVGRPLQSLTAVLNFPSEPMSSFPSLLLLYQDRPAEGAPSVYLDQAPAYITYCKPKDSDTAIIPTSCSS